MHRQLSGVPENALKMGVGLMLVSFGTFWSGEGVHVDWPGSDLAIPVLVAVYGRSRGGWSDAVAPQGWGLHRSVRTPGRSGRRSIRG